MNTLIQTRRTLSFIIAVTAIFLTSCDDTEAGIFSRVAAETPTSENMTEAIQGATPSFVVRLGTTYYAGIKTLWQKSDAAKQWAEATVPGAFAGTGTVIASSGSVIKIGGTTDTLFVAFSDSTGTSLGIWSTTDGTNWARADSAFPAVGSKLRIILAANDQLFAVSSTVAADLTETYSIYHYNGTLFESAGFTPDATIGLPNSVAYANGAYWFTAGGFLLSGTLPTNIAKVALGPNDWPAGSTVAVPLAATYGGVCAINGTGILVSGRNGKLFYSVNGTSWITSTEFKSASSELYSFSIPTYIDTTKVLAVGTNGIPRSSSDTPPMDGYLEFDLTAGFSAEIVKNEAHALLSSAVNFSASLAGLSVIAMPFFDLPTTKKVFALTDGDGLWSNTYADDADTAATDLVWGGWVRE